MPSDQYLGFCKAGLRFCALGQDCLDGWFVMAGLLTGGSQCPNRLTSHRFLGGKCRCGQIKARWKRLCRATLTRPCWGLFPEPVLRRTLLKSVGASVLLGALSSIVPIGDLKAIAHERGPLEKTKLNVGFLAITCATPLIYGEQLGTYSKEGLEVLLQKIPGIALIRDKMVSGELDVSQQVMPVALTMTAGTRRQPAIDQGAVDLEPEWQLSGSGDEAQGQPRSQELEGLHLRHSVRSESSGAPAAQLPLPRTVSIRTMM